MTKIKIQVDADTVKAAQEQGEFEQAPVGIYVGELVEITQEYAKGEDGKPDKDRKYLKCIWKLVGVGREGAKSEKNYSRVWDNVSFSESAKWKMAQFGLALGLKVVRGRIEDSIEIEEGKPGTVIGTKALLSLRKDTNQDGEYRPKVGNLMNMAEVEANESLFDEDEDADEDEQDDEEFEGDEEDEAEEDEADEAYTKDNLDGLTLKELGAIAADEFDLDPKTLIIRNARSKKVNTAATTKALVGAILEAQGFDEEEEGDEEDPF